MQDYTPYQRYPTTPTAAKSHAEFLTLATLRYKIHEAVSNIKTESDLRKALETVTALTVADEKNLPEFT